MQTESFERDGISYTISLYEREGQYRALWTCLDCEQSGGQLGSYSTAAEAVGRAKALVVLDHHVPHHVLPAEG